MTLLCNPPRQMIGILSLAFRSMGAEGQMFYTSAVRLSIKTLEKPGSRV